MQLANMNVGNGQPLFVIAVEIEGMIMSAANGESTFLNF